MSGRPYALDRLGSDPDRVACRLLTGTERSHYPRWRPIERQSLTECGRLYQGSKADAVARCYYEDALKASAMGRDTALREEILFVPTVSGGNAAGGAELKMR